MNSMPYRIPSLSIIGILLLLVLGLGACAEQASPTTHATDDRPTVDAAPALRDAQAQADAPACAYGQIVCEGLKRKICDGKGGFGDEFLCEAYCADGVGCVACEPNHTECADGLAKICQANGANVREVIFSCNGPGMTCTSNGCEGPCSPTKLARSHAGCDFWPTVTPNQTSTAAGAFHFGLLLGNPSSTAAANVWITGPGPGNPYRTSPLVLAPNEVQEVALDFVPQLKGTDWQTPYLPQSPTESVNLLKGSHHVQSDQPIIAYQFNTLEAQAATTSDGFSCTGSGNVSGGPCYSRSMDASLLLPSHVLSASGGDWGGEDVDAGGADREDAGTGDEADGGTHPTDPFYYVVGGYHAWHAPTALDAGLPRSGGVGDFLVITAVEDNTSLKVGLSKTASVLPWAEPMQFEAGQPTTITMGSFQVIALYNDGLGGSFSGTTIRANRPVHVFSGHPCAAIPDDSTTCGHMEDVVLPYYALGTQYVLVPPGDSNSPTPYSVRIQAPRQGGKDTLVTFDPAEQHAVVSLSPGDFIELANRTKPLVVQSEGGPIVVTQLASSRGDRAASDADPYRVGGPNQLAVVPASQYMKRLAFASAPGFRSTYVQIIAQTGSKMTVDDEQAAISADKFTAIGSSGFSYTVRPLTSSTGVHVIQSDKPVGVVVQGVGPYASYLYAGGMAFEPASF